MRCTSLGMRYVSIKNGLLLSATEVHHISYSLIEMHSKNVLLPQELYLLTSVNICFLYGQ